MQFYHLYAFMEIIYKLIGIQAIINFKMNCRSNECNLSEMNYS